MTLSGIILGVPSGSELEVSSFQEYYCVQAAGTEYLAWTNLIKAGKMPASWI